MQKSLRIIAISDTHGSQKEMETFFSDIKGTRFPFDVCILLGDMYYQDIEFVTENVPKEKIIAVSGNHDSHNFFEQFGIPVIDGKVVTYNGIRIAGIGGALLYKEGEIGYQTQKDSVKAAKAMPKAEVLISHAGVYSWKTRHCHCGLKGINRYIRKNHVKYHLHGHNHNQDATRLCGCKSFGVYVCKAFDFCF